LSYSSYFPHFPVISPAFAAGVSDRPGQRVPLPLRSRAGYVRTMRAPDGVPAAALEPATEWSSG